MSRRTDIISFLHCCRMLLIVDSSACKGIRCVMNADDDNIAPHRCVRSRDSKILS